MSRGDTHRLTRRAAMVGGLAAAIGLGRHWARGQQAGGETAGGREHATHEDRGIMLKGKTALVTGSTDGLGRAVARELGALGASVIVHGRDGGRGRAVVREIEAGAGSAVFYPADLASLAAVRHLADTVLDHHERLDILVNNAGIWSEGGDSRRTSADGHELVFAVNYLSHFLLTHRLLPLLEQSAPARIVNVASAAQRPIDFDDVMLTRGFSAARAYAQSKLAQVMFTFDLARELAGDGITVNSLHPATLMDTSMVREAGARPRSTVDEGVRAVMHLAVSPELDGRTGLYFNGMREARAHAQAYDGAARAALWELSMRLTGLA